MKNDVKKAILDGNTACALGAYALSDACAIYPITPSTTMAELCDSWSEEGKKNIFGRTVDVTQMQSEAGAAGALHGMASGGVLATTFSASQGLLLLVPNMYKLAGEQLPVVFHITARTVATHALSIFGDHSDIYAIRQTGCIMLASCSVQEAYDNAIMAHLISIESSMPVVHFFDGFRTSHETNECFLLDNEQIKSLVNFDKIKKFKDRALNSSNPKCQGTAQNPDIFFQNREAANTKWNEIDKVIDDVFARFEKLTGRKYAKMEYFGDKDAKTVVVSMASSTKTLTSVAKTESSVGVVNVRAYRPFDGKTFVNMLPKSCTTVCVLDRAKELNGIGEPLFVDVCAALQVAKKNVKVIGGRYGLGGKDFTPAQAKAVFDNANAKESKTNFSVGINDDVTNLSLPVDNNYQSNEDFYSAKFYGLGSDGTVGANKNSIKILGDHTDFRVQAYFEYDSKKSGSITVSHLRFGKNPIDAPYLINSAHFVAVHNQSFLHRFNMAKKLKTNGIFLINTNKSESELSASLPNALKKELRSKKARVYYIDAFAVASKLGLGKRINLVMQSAFFNLLCEEYKGKNFMSFDKAKDYMKDYARKTYANKGDKVIEANVQAIEQAEKHLFAVDVNTLNDTAEIVLPPKSPYYQRFVQPINSLEGNDLPVSIMNPDGGVPTGTSVEEKRDIAEILPKFVAKNCIQCNMCSLVCPHATIRPVLVPESVKAPESFETTPCNLPQLKGYNTRLQVYPKDCTGCGMCAKVCPAREKALVMVSKDEIFDAETTNIEFAQKQKMPEATASLPLNVRSSQYKRPYFEFSGACAGCGETPYIKLLTQLYGKNLIIANATGCTSIYGGNAPTCPYTKDEEGRGPAWANSLFEDNAEFGYGIYLAYKNRRKKIFEALEQSKAKDKDVEEFLTNFASVDFTSANKNKIVAFAKKNNIKAVLDDVDAVAAQHVVFMGGDGWAYDIGFGGLDHVLASGENIKILVLDTEVYSNTGGQASKSTQLGGVARFTDGGKRTPKKRLGQMMMSYGNVFVAEVAMGANMQHTVDAIKQAMEYNGPAIIIAYATCINQGLDMSNGMAQMKQAHEAGYFYLYTYNPAAAQKFKFLSQPPNGKLIEHLETEIRYKTLVNKNKEAAKILFERAKQDAEERYKTLKNMEKSLNGE